MNCQKIIVVADPFSAGHHLAFMRMFCQAFLELNFKVWAFFGGSSEKLVEWISGNIVDANNNFNSFHLSPPQVISTTSNMKLVLNVAQEWRKLAVNIKQVEVETGQKADSVFIAWLDTYLINLLPGYIVDILFPYKWTGLYFHPNHMRLESYEKKASITSIDSVLLSRGCQSIAVHDPVICESYRLRIGKDVFFLPEVADLTPPSKDNAIALAVKKQAENRRIIGIIGLSPHQGLKAFCELAIYADEKDFFFVFAGERPLSLTSHENEMLDFISTQKTNCFCHFHYLQEGAEYNSVLNSLDVIWLVYNNFASTSNRLTKAVFLNKVVLASKGYILGELVDTYKLGKVISTNSPEEIIKIINDLFTEQASILLPNYAEYMKINNYEFLKSQLNKIIQSIQ